MAGSFSFKPSVDQVGDFSITFSVSDGELTDSKTIIITVNGASGNGVTALQGQILDANDADQNINTPIAGAIVRHIESGISTTTDNNGNFVLSGLPTGEQHFEYDGSTATAQDGSGSVYGAYRGERI